MTPVAAGLMSVLVWALCFAVLVYTATPPARQVEEQVASTGRVAFFFDRGCSGPHLALTEGIFHFPAAGFAVSMTYTDFPHFAAEVEITSPDDKLLQLELQLCGSARLTAKLYSPTQTNAWLSILCMYANECQNLNLGFVNVVLDGRRVQSMLWLPGDGGSHADVFVRRTVSANNNTTRAIERMKDTRYEGHGM